MMTTIFYTVRIRPRTEGECEELDRLFESAVGPGGKLVSMTSAAMTSEDLDELLITTIAYEVEEEWKARE